EQKKRPFWGAFSFASVAESRAEEEISLCVRLRNHFAGADLITRAADGSNARPVVPCIDFPGEIHVPSDERCDSGGPSQGLRLWFGHQVIRTCVQAPGTFVHTLE